MVYFTGIRAQSAGTALKQKVAGYERNQRYHPRPGRQKKDRLGPAQHAAARRPGAGVYGRKAVCGPENCAFGASGGENRLPLRGAHRGRGRNVYHGQQSPFDPGRRRGGPGRAGTQRLRRPRPPAGRLRTAARKGHRARAEHHHRRRRRPGEPDPRQIRLPAARRFGRLRGDDDGHHAPESDGEGRGTEVPDDRRQRRAASTCSTTATAPASRSGTASTARPTSSSRARRSSSPVTAGAEKASPCAPKGSALAWSLRKSTPSKPSRQSWTVSRS